MMKKQLLSMAMLMVISLSASAQQLLPYQNPNLSAEARANDLLFPSYPGGEDEVDDGYFASHRPIRHSAVPVVERGAAWSGKKRICYRFSYHDAHGGFVGRYLII